TEIYERNTAFLRERFQAYANGELLQARVRAVYPFVRITTHTHSRLDSRLAYGLVAGPGVHGTTVTRPDLFRAYYIAPIARLPAPACTRLPSPAPISSASITSSRSACCSRTMAYPSRSASRPSRSRFTSPFVAT